MSKFVVDILPVSKLFLGEGPHWDAKTQNLYYVDLFGKAVHRYDPATKQESKVVVQDKGQGEQGVGFVVPVEGESQKFVIGLGHSLRVLEWDGKSENGKAIGLKTLQVTEDDNTNGRFNDGKCDSSGRLWAGTMGAYDGEKFVPASDAKKGRLYSLEKDGQLKKHLDSIDISNGLTWSADNKTFYYIDSLKFLVEAFDFDIVKGSISNRRKIFDLKTHNLVGAPDGMTIDSNGNLWVAVFGGGKILNIDPTSGKLLATVELPATNITSVTFGGQNLDILYATSAQKDLSKEQLAAQPAAGALFQITNTGVRGLSAGVTYSGKV